MAADSLRPQDGEHAKRPANRPGSGAPVTTLAFFDDYAHERGHHPDLIVGLGIAAEAPIYCPGSFLEGRSDAAHLRHRAMTGASDDPSVVQANLQSAYDDAASLGRAAFVNLFLDENWDSFPIRRGGPRVVHSLHRPGELTGTLGGVNATKPGDPVAGLRSLAGPDLVVVHTATGKRQALQWLPPRNVLWIGWPATREVDLRRRLAAARDHAGAGPGSAEPYVLLIGEALEYKGIHCLLEALNPGPPLRIAGNLAVGGADWLAREYPKARVAWEPSWITRSRLDELVAGAAVIAFPYLAGFDAHGGVSGALVHALTAGKPVVISKALASQAPEAPSCRVVSCGDAQELRQAIDWALANSIDLHQAARDLEAYLISQHTYERHVQRLVERLSEGV